MWIIRLVTRFPMLLHSLIYRSEPCSMSNVLGEVQCTTQFVKTSTGFFQKTAETTTQEGSNYEVHVYALSLSFNTV